VKAQVYLFNASYREPFIISLGTSTVTTNVIIRIEKNDIEGWGEASPSPRILGDDIDYIIKTLENIYPKIQKLDELTPEKIYEVIHSSSGSLSAKAGLEIALLDIWSKEIGKPLYKLLGGYRDFIETDITIGIMEPEEQAKRALRYVEEGFRIIKLKLGLDPDKDVKRVRTVRDVVGEGIKIRVDANQGWSVKEAIKVIDKISDYDVELVEQPVKYDDIEGLVRVKKESSIPIAADESVKTPEDAIRVIKKEAVDIINIKLMKSEGILGAIKIASISEAAGIKNMIGCMGESRLGITAAVHTALAIRNIQYYDLDSDLLLTDDPVISGGALRDNSKRFIKYGKGLCIENIDLTKLKYHKEF